MRAEWFLQRNSVAERLTCRLTSTILARAGRIRQLTQPVHWTIRDETNARFQSGLGLIPRHRPQHATPILAESTDQQVIHGPRARLRAELTEDFTQQ